jgi:hypothetical protein
VIGQENQHNERTARDDSPAKPGNQGRSHSRTRVGKPLDRFDLQLTQGGANGALTTGVAPIDDGSDIITHQHNETVVRDDSRSKPHKQRRSRKRIAKSLDDAGLRRARGGATSAPTAGIAPPDDGTANTDHHNHNETLVRDDSQSM